MTNLDGVEVRETLKELVDDYFFLQTGHLPDWVALYPLVEVLLVKTHCDIEVLAPVLPRDVGIENLADEVVVEHLHDLNFPVAVPTVLHHSLNSHDLPVTPHPPSVDLPEGALPDQVQYLHLLTEKRRRSRVQTHLSVHLL